MKRRIIIIFIVLFISVGLFVYYGQRKNRAGELFYSGTIEATQAELSFQVPGRVAKVNFKEGQSVQKDELIAELDRAELEARYGQAKALVQSASDTLVNAQKNYERFEELFRKGVVSEKERDNLKLTYEIAQAKLAEAKALLKQASVYLDYTQLKAPMDGVITSRNIEPGETVTAGREVITVSDLSGVELKIFVEETQIGKVRPNQEVDVTVDTFPGKIYKGKISFISPEGEFTPKTIQTKKERVKLVYLVKVTIDNPHYELKTGMPADALLKP
ncbi:MAG TPA: efflux RND transporter periplasmic adaptor subunit [Smithellaceae bacterium]|nr:efflux RND transporter periplasmic adaptor subunit [Syntrophaceae bacterium]MDX9816628.1 efflux RND transporter periplasmic adaptor subunit [Smithellaceae bacterium]NMD06148.1 efflux RND transporter periplasmic adaptor subunit [Deltaproteobacteria bacterium]MBP8609130.1 efflux RND transporter periplasmic adaptor subunit [Syntrophaceae bacterium]HNQ19394.1 efflux RND transporter periplasmic adaptor subunit [Smithellaceae bacterium]